MLDIRSALASAKSLQNTLNGLRAVSVGDSALMASYARSMKTASDSAVLLNTALKGFKNPITSAAVKNANDYAAGLERAASALRDMREGIGALSEGGKSGVLEGALTGVVAGRTAGVAAGAAAVKEIGRGYRDAARSTDLWARSVGQGNVPLKEQIAIQRRLRIESGARTTALMEELRTLGPADNARRVAISRQLRDETLLRRNIADTTNVLQDRHRRERDNDRREAQRRAKRAAEAKAEVRRLKEYNRVLDKRDNAVLARYRRALRQQERQAQLERRRGSIFVGGGARRRSGALLSGLGGLGARSPIGAASAVGLSGIAGGGAILGAVLGATLGVASIAASDTLRRLRSQIRLVSADVRGTERELRNMAVRTRSSFESVVTVFARTRRALQSLDPSISQLDTERFTESIQQLVRISGSGPREAQGALIQLSQGLASNRLGGEELRSVMEQIPAVAIRIAQGMGKSLGELREISRAGELEAIPVMRSILKQAAAIAAEFETIDPLAGDITRTLGDALVHLTGATAQATGLDKLWISIASSARDWANSVAEGLSRESLPSERALERINTQRRQGFTVGAFRDELNLLISNTPTPLDNRQLVAALATLPRRTTPEFTGRVIEDVLRENVTQDWVDQLNVARDAALRELAQLNRVRERRFNSLLGPTTFGAFALRSVGLGSLVDQPYAALSEDIEGVETRVRTLTSVVGLATDVMNRNREAVRKAVDEMKKLQELQFDVAVERAGLNRLPVLENLQLEITRVETLIALNKAGITDEDRIREIVDARVTLRGRELKAARDTALESFRAAEKSSKNTQLLEAASSKGQVARIREQGRQEQQEIRRNTIAMLKLEGDFARRMEILRAGIAAENANRELQNAREAAARAAALERGQSVVDGFNRVEASDAGLSTVQRILKERGKALRDNESAFQDANRRLDDEADIAYTERNRLRTELEQASANNTLTINKNMLNELREFYSSTWLSIGQSVADVLRSWEDNTRNWIALLVDTLPRLTLQILDLVEASRQLRGPSGSGVSPFARVGSFFDRIFGGRRASGGPVGAGYAYLVGERGPELFVPGQSGSIVPNGGAGSVVVNLPVVDLSADVQAQLTQFLPLMANAALERVQGERL